MHIVPTAEQVTQLQEAAGDDAPVVMLNLLRFRDADDHGNPGREAYARYAEAAAGHLARVGGELLWAGDCAEAIIGPPAREWDSVALVRYPSRAAFLEMVADPDYLEAATDRTGALADSRLIPCAGLATPAT